MVTAQMVPATSRCVKERRSFFIRVSFFELSLGVFKFSAVYGLKFSHSVIKFLNLHKYTSNGAVAVRKKVVSIGHFSPSSVIEILLDQIKSNCMY